MSSFWIFHEHRDSTCHISGLYGSNHWRAAGCRVGDEEPFGVSVKGVEYGVAI